MPRFTRTSATVRPKIGSRALTRKTRPQWQRVHEIMRAFSARSIAFMASLLKTVYARTGRSITQVSGQSRKKAARLRCIRGMTCLHFDSFPTRPSHGDRLLRIFANIHPEQPRVWLTTDHFEALRRPVRRQDRLDSHARAWLDVCKHAAVKLAAGMGLPVIDRPPYDRFMLKIHHAMKEDAAFQQTCRKDRWEFPAGSTWIVFTDGASHACLSGQYALEQTFIIRRGEPGAAPKSPRSRSSSASRGIRWPGRARDGHGLLCQRLDGRAATKAWLDLRARQLDRTYRHVLILAASCRL